MAPWPGSMVRSRRRRPIASHLIALSVVLGLAAVGLAGQDGVRGRVDDGLNLTVVAGRPTPASLTFSVHADEALEVYLELGGTPGQVSRRTAMASTAPERPAELTVGALAPGTRYFYRVRYRRPGQQAYATEPEQMIATARRGTGAFSFGVQGASRPDDPAFDVERYARTLDRARRELLDFYVLLGDDFGAPLLESRTDADARYRRQRRFLAPLASSTPIFLVAGAEDGLQRGRVEGAAGSTAVFAADARTRFFPLPGPDGFYTGDEQTLAPVVGVLRDYYAWTWGEALFVVVDPSWWSASPVPDSWDVSLGDGQYRWLVSTLERSGARYKFVFTHQVPGAGVSGLGPSGGFEWGGRDPVGATFEARRPGWSVPIHALLARTGVSIVFTGHDRRFAKEDVDGVVYQSVPSPSARGGDADDPREGAGHLRVSVSSDNARVDYVRSVLPSEENDTRQDGDVAVTYTVTGRR